MLNPFLVHMGTGEAIFWGGATYLSAIVGGYLVGKGLFDRDWNERFKVQNSFGMFSYFLYSTSYRSYLFGEHR